jgi:hypothetical protein
VPNVIAIPVKRQLPDGCNIVHRAVYSPIFYSAWLGQADPIGPVPDIAIAFASRNGVPRTNAILLIQLEKYRIAGTEKTNGGPA